MAGKKKRMRGKRTHGYGSKKKHRGGGSRGGRGYAGSHKHKYSFVTTKEKNHFGYKGFASRKQREKTINLDELRKLAKDKKQIDLTSLGYGKLLARGSISFPLAVSVRKYSKSAKKKLEEAGGKIVS